MSRSRSVRALALILSGLLFASCFSTQAVGRRPSAGQGGGVAVQVFPDDDSREAGLVLSGGIVGELERLEGGGQWVPVFRSLDARWTVLGLKPGKYRVRFPARLDDAGNEVALETRPKIVRVRADQVTEVETVVEHVPPVLVAAGVATAVVAAALLWDWLDDLGLPAPPLPHPPPELVEAVFHVAVEVAIASDGYGRSPGGSPPFVTSHFPEDGDWVAARRVRVTFAMSEPIDRKEVDPDAVMVEGERSGPVPGHISYDPSHWWIVWEPLEDLPRDEELEVTLAPGSVEDLTGMELDGSATFRFRTTR
jgi:hypothetical protein